MKNLALGASATQIPWVDPDELFADDGIQAHSDNLSALEYTEFLFGHEYGFSVPTDSTLVGIKVEVNFVDPAWPAGFSPNDVVIQLRHNGSLIGSNKATLTDIPVGVQTGGSMFYGGKTDMWGTSLTPTKVNDESFGVVIQYQQDHSGAPSNSTSIDVDTIRVTVFYCQ